jgi:hypothetical protein
VQVGLLTVQFPMQNENGVLVPVSVTIDYLRARLGLPDKSDEESMLNAFETVRPELEALASAKYDRGEPTYITTDDRP